MFRRAYYKTQVWAVPLIALPASLVRCSGTEADNPVTDLVVTYCKTEDEYDPDQVDDFLTGAQTSVSGVPKGTDPPGALRQPLTSTADFPMGLFCIEWQVSESQLGVQFVNFGSGCGVEWEGNTRLSGDRVTFELENAICAVAACGSCLYDTASVIELPTESDVTLALSLDSTCDGSPEVREWRLPISNEPRGMICEFARPPGLGGITGLPFMRCGAPEAPCEPGLMCLDEGEFNAHCLPVCSVDADCPLPGGTRCIEGLCRPASSIATDG